MSFPGSPDLEEEHGSNTNIDETGTMADDGTGASPRLSGGRRLLQGLKRMSSSQSLLRLHRSPSSGYRGTGRGAISCISLSSSSATNVNAFGSSYGSQFSQPFSTAPTSVAGTPGRETPPDDGLRIKFVKENVLPPSTRTPLSIGLPTDVRLGRPATSAGELIVEEDYFPAAAEQPPQRPALDFWGDMPPELKSSILRLLEPRDVVRCSRVSKAWYAMCYDGHLWSDLDTSNFYSKIPADALASIITKAGPFARDLNLRGCVQLWDRWRDSSLATACANLENLSLQDCRIDRSSMHNLLIHNSRLVHLNISGLPTVTNATLKIIANKCPRLEHLNVSWCHNIDAKGLKSVIESCDSLRDLRAGEVRGFEDVSVMDELFRRNTLERLVLMNCDSLTEDAFRVMIEGLDPEKDYLTGQAIVPPRRLKHLDIARCRGIGDDGISALVGNVPYLEGLQLAKCNQVSDSSLMRLFPTVPQLTHLDLEELDQLSNAALQELARSPCKSVLRHLSVSYCENVGDVGMLPIIRECTALSTLELDNTRISDLVLIEAASAIRARPAGTQCVDKTGRKIPRVALSMVVYDCQNVTWIGIREILSRNTQARGSKPTAMPQLNLNTSISQLQLLNASQLSMPAPASPSSAALAYTPDYPTQIIALKVFYGYQPTVLEHTRRCMRGDFAAAARLERKWAEFMVASEEAGAPGGFGPGGFGLFTGVAGRRRRRRIREAAMMHADEEDEGGVGGGVGRRRRARSGGGCAVM